MLGSLRHTLGLALPFPPLSHPACLLCSPGLLGPSVSLGLGRGCPPWSVRPRCSLSTLATSVFGAWVSLPLQLLVPCLDCFPWDPKGLLRGPAKDSWPLPHHPHSPRTLLSLCIFLEFALSICHL